MTAEKKGDKERETPESRGTKRRFTEGYSPPPRPKPKPGPEPERRELR